MAPKITYSTRPAVATPKAKTLPTIQSVIAQGAASYKRLTPTAPVSSQPTKPLDYANTTTAGGGWTPFTPPATSPAPGAKGQYAAEQAAGTYESDPILAQTKQAMTGQVATRVGDTNRTIKDALTAFGDPTLARQATFYTSDPSVTTQGDEQTAQAAAANPLSTLAQLAQAHQQRQIGLDQNLSNANLFHSSTRGNELGNENQQYLGEQANAQSQLGQALSAAVRDLLGSRDSAGNAVSQAEADAYSRALSLALQYGTDPTDTAGAGGSGLTPGTPITPDLLKPGVLGAGWDEKPLTQAAPAPAQSKIGPAMQAQFAQTVPASPAFAGGPVVNDTIGNVPASVLAQVKALFGKPTPKPQPLLATNAAQVRRNAY